MVKIALILIGLLWIGEAHAQNLLRNVTGQSAPDIRVVDGGQGALKTRNRAGAPVALYQGHTLSYPALLETPSSPGGPLAAKVQLKDGSVLTLGRGAKGALLHQSAEHLVVRLVSGPFRFQRGALVSKDAFVWLVLPTGVLLADGAEISGHAGHAAGAYPLSSLIWPKEGKAFLTPSSQITKLANKAGALEALPQAPFDGRAINLQVSTRDPKLRTFRDWVRYSAYDTGEVRRAADRQALVGEAAVQALIAARDGHSLPVSGMINGMALPPDQSEAPLIGLTCAPLDCLTIEAAPQSLPLFQDFSAHLNAWGTGRP